MPVKLGAMRKLVQDPGLLLVVIIYLIVSNIEIQGIDLGLIAFPILFIYLVFYVNNRRKKVKQTREERRNQVNYLIKQQKQRTVQTDNSSEVFCNTCGNTTSEADQFCMQCGSLVV